MQPEATPLIYEVECRLDPSIVAAFDAWLPGHVRDVLACDGFTGAEIQVPDVDAGELPVRRTQYRLASREALERYLREDAPRLRADALQHFGDKVSYTRRVLVPGDAAERLSAPPARCQNCNAVVTGKYCVECGQSAAVHVLSISDVTHDVVHSALHLDSRVWRTLRSLVLKPGELTREFIAGRRQRYLPPFRLYLIISLAFFALSALLPDSGLVRGVDSDRDVTAPVTLRLPGDEALPPEAQQVQQALEGVLDDPDTPEAVRQVAAEASRKLLAIETPSNCAIAVGWPRIDALLADACEKLRADGGKRLGEVFLQNAPKLMFLFLPLMAAVAMLFSWRPRRLYAEHLILFLHVHAFVFLWLSVTTILEALSKIDLPLIGLLAVLTLALTAYLAWYVFRAMRVVYGEGRMRTAVKFIAIGSIYFVLLGLTLVVGVVYSVLSL